MDHLIEDLTCSVCLNLYDDPRLLKCSHTFCKNCLENIMRASDSYFWRLSVGELKCPTCRRITDLSTGVHTLPVNFALKSIVEKVNSNKQSSAKSCPEHCRKPLSLFCLKDRTLICVECCEVGQHQGHRTEDLDRAYANEGRTASKLLATLRDKDFTGVSMVIKALEEQREECETIIQEDKKEVINFFDKTIAILEQKKQHFLAALNDLNQKVADAYAPQIEAMRQIQDEELDLISLASTTQDEQSPLVYLDNIQAIEKGMEALRKQQLCSVADIHIYPRARQILKDRWVKTTIADAHKQPTPNFEFKWNANSPSNVPFKCIFLVTLLLLLFYTYADSLFTFTSCCWNYLLKTMEPVLGCFGIQIFTVKSTSQRLAQSALDFISYLYSLPRAY